MGVDKVIANLLRVAKGDLDDARRLAEVPSRNAIYLCEQAAEKVILAVVASEGKHGNIQHMLDKLVDLVPDENPLKSQLRKLQDLGFFATSYRYPSSSGNVKPQPDRAEFDRHAANVQFALNAAVAGFKVDLSRPSSPAGSAAPLR
ncbi:MAG: HEPN domain-containing protein [Planctomycetota bacterium]